MRLLGPANIAGMDSAHSTALIQAIRPVQRGKDTAVQRGPGSRGHEQACNRKRD
jgi:hypothetical protein